MAIPWSIAYSCFPSHLLPSCRQRHIIGDISQRITLFVQHNIANILHSNRTNSCYVHGQSNFGSDVELGNSSTLHNLSFIYKSCHLNSLLLQATVRVSYGCISTKNFITQIKHITFNRGLRCSCLDVNMQKILREYINNLWQTRLASSTDLSNSHERYTKLDPGGSVR